MRIDHHAAAGAIRVGTLGGALRPRVLGLAESLPGPSWFAMLIEAGTARIAGEDTPLRGPELAWRPWHGGARATFDAGTAGIYVILGATALANAVGHMPESGMLRDMAGRAVTVPLTGEAAESVRAAFRGLSREVGSEAAAAHAVIEAHLRVILVEIYRRGQPRLAGSEGAAPAHRLFSEFGALVEARFRERWGVGDYSRALGISRDRLGDICRRVRGMGPKQLIDRRVTLEARLQLENSSSPVQEIAAVLGFASPAQFSRFFGRTIGMPPGRYRAEYRGGVRSSVSDLTRPYDWP